MSGLIVLAGLIVGIAIAFWLLGHVRGAALQITIAALMLGGAGYALQGRPGFDGAPHSGSTRAVPLPLTGARHAIYGQFTSSERWLVIADGFASRGNTGEAVGAIRAGLKANPRNSVLWTGLGNALVDHAGMLTPAAELAYGHAVALAPKHPGPLFFRGLALARSGQRDEAIADWRQALSLTPPKAAYRQMIQGGIDALSSPPTR